MRISEPAVQAKHTATPWNTMPNTGPMAMPGTSHLYNLVRIKGNKITTLAENMTFDDAVFAKRACNAHEELVAALQDARERMLGSGSAITALRKKTDAALAKATGSGHHE